MRYIQLRWPKLDISGRRSAMEIYTNPINLAYLGRQLGLPEALNPEFLFQSISKEAFRAQEASLRPKSTSIPKKLVSTAREECIRHAEYLQTRTDNIKHAASLAALIGALSRSSQQREHENQECEFSPMYVAWTFINRVILSCVFDTRQLVKPLYPIAAFTEHLRKHGELAPGEQVTFRMLRESGRASHNSMYQVGVFASPLGHSPIYGQGFLFLQSLGAGVSVRLAQQRACVEALRKRLLEDRGHQRVPFENPLENLDLVTELSTFLEIKVKF